MTKTCASRLCQLPPLLPSDGRIEIKAVLPANWSGIRSSFVKWKRNGVAVFHEECWSVMLKMARSRGSSGRKSTGNGATAASPAPEMKHTEKLMIVTAAKTLEKFDSMEDIKNAAERAATVIRNADHCIGFTGAGISTSAGLGDFRGKSGKWTEADQTALEGVIQAALQMDTSGASTSSAQGSTPGPGKSDQAMAAGGSSAVKSEAVVNPESPVKKCKSGGKEENVKEEPADEFDDSDEEAEQFVNYDNLRPTYTHEALALLLERGLMHYLVSQNCDGLHLLSGIPLDRISELHGNVFVEKCTRCDKRYHRKFYVPFDGASRYFKETGLTKPTFVIRCKSCGLCHRTGRHCEEKGCGAYLEDTIINFRDNLEEAGLNRAWKESGKSDVILCLGTTLMVTPACDIVDEAKGDKPLIICNRQKTAKDHLAQIRVFGDCDVFMAEVLAHLLDKEDKKQWEKKRAERMQTYSLQRRTAGTRQR